MQAFKLVRAHVHACTRTLQRFSVVVAVQRLRADAGLAPTAATPHSLGLRGGNVCKESLPFDGKSRRATQG